MNADQVALVLAVASLTEDRDDAEQRAMLEVALWADTQRARFTTLTRRQTPLTRAEGPIHPYLTELVDVTYDPDFPKTRKVELTATQRGALAKLKAKFVPCPRCEVPAGAHASECLAADLKRAGVTL